MFQTNKKNIDFTSVKVDANFMMEFEFPEEEKAYIASLIDRPMEKTK